MVNKATASITRSREHDLKSSMTPGRFIQKPAELGTPCDQEKVPLSGKGPLGPPQVQVGSASVCCASVLQLRIRKMGTMRWVAGRTKRMSATRPGPCTHNLHLLYRENCGQRSHCGRSCPSTASSSVLGPHCLPPGSGCSSV